MARSAERLRARDHDRRYVLPERREPARGARPPRRAARLAARGRQPHAGPGAQVRLWTSARRGASLTLVLPPGDVCGAVITLAYLASKATGPFRLTCAHGCACSPIRTYWQRRLQPFPIVTGQEDCNGETRNCDGLQVTRDTSFDLLREREGECRVTVTVLMNRRVRLDGLYVQTPSEETAAYMRGHASSTTAQRRFGERARSQRCNKTRTVEMTR